MLCEELRSCCSPWSSFLPGLSSQILRLLDGGNHCVPNWNSFPNPCTRSCALSASDRPCERTKVSAVNALGSLPKRSRHTSVRPRSNYSASGVPNYKIVIEKMIEISKLRSGLFPLSFVISFLGKQANQRHAHDGLGFCRVVHSRLM